ncbi:MAG: serine/threonine-protein kinase, partial [archaeon]|nr:serine/threonine-protein kinase [archaeon]
MASRPTPDNVQALAAEKYTVRDVLGQGQFSTVVLARRKHETVAIKILDSLKIFSDEVTILTQLGEHPNVVGYSGAWTRDSTYCIEFAYLDGRPMLDSLTEAPFSEARAHALFVQLVEGVAHAHSRRVAHMNLKAENLLLSPDLSTLTIIGWGMGLRWVPGKLRTHIRGSPDYAAPEIFRNEPFLGPECDVWAMGVLLYVMVTSEFPFGAETPAKVMHRICLGSYAPPPRCSAALLDLLARMLVPSPFDRIEIPAICDHPWFRNPPAEPAQSSTSFSP